MAIHLESQFLSFIDTESTDTFYILIPTGPDQNDWYVEVIILIIKRRFRVRKVYCLHDNV